MHLLSSLRCVVLCCVALRCVALRCVVLCCAVLRCVALCCAVLRCVALCSVCVCVKGEAWKRKGRSLRTALNPSPFKAFTCKPRPQDKYQMFPPFCHCYHWPGPRYQYAREDLSLARAGTDARKKRLDLRRSAEGATGPSVRPNPAGVTAHNGRLHKGTRLCLHRPTVDRLWKTQAPPEKKQAFLTLLQFATQRMTRSHAT